MAELAKRLQAIYHQRRWVPRRPAIDELVYTILSQNTSDLNSLRAEAQLKRRFGTWEELLSADVAEVELAIRVGGISHVKAARIKAVLQRVLQSQGCFDLEVLDSLDLDGALGYLTNLPGVGPKTAACVLLFALGRPAFPVDTHVFRVAGRLGLLPPRANLVQAHGLMREQVPETLRYQFHLNLVLHGRRICQARRPRCGLCTLADRCPSYQTYGAADPTGR